MTARLILVFVLSVLVGLIINAPSERLLPWVIDKAVPKSLGIELIGIRGGLLDGGAARVRYQNTEVRELRWRVKPAALLTLKLAADIDISLNSRDLDQDNAWLSASIMKPLLSSRIHVRDLHAAAASEQLQGLLKLAYLPVTAQLEARIDSLTLHHMKPESITGEVVLSRSYWTLGKREPLGQFQALISTTDEGIIEAKIADAEDGRVDIDALAALQADGRYQLEARLKPKATTPTAVVNHMKGLGRTDRQGWYNIQQSGQI